MAGCPQNRHTLFSGLPLNLSLVLRSEDQNDRIGFSTNRNISTGNTCTVPRHGKHLAGAQQSAPLQLAYVDRNAVFAGQATPKARHRLCSSRLSKSFGKNRAQTRFPLFLDAGFEGKCAFIEIALR
jgi:hypothetical protein